MDKQEVISEIKNAYNEIEVENPFPGNWLQITDKEREKWFEARRSLEKAKLQAIISKYRLTREQFEPAHKRVLAIKEIKHAFADASVNRWGESEDENRREYREMLEMHTDITQERYGFSDEELEELVVEVATEIGAKEAYDWAYGIGGEIGKGVPQ